MKKQNRIGMFGFGKTGREVANQFNQDPDVKLCWIIRGSKVAQEADFEGVPIYLAKEIDIFKHLESNPVDFIVDFSNSETCIHYAPIAARLNIGIVSAVSAYEEQHLEILKNASKDTAVLYSPNITLGINFIIIAGKILRKLAPHAGVEVIEEHFYDKKEVSGTAIRIAELLNLDPQQHVNSIRVGGIVGRHEIIFGFPNQTIRLTHDSINRAAFGQGALFALKNLYGRPPGFYTMEQLVSEGFSEALR